MKNSIKNLFILTLSVALLAACGDSKDKEPKTKSTTDFPTSFNVLKGGTLSPQSSTNTRGMFQLVEDDQGDFFVRLTDDFTTKFSTGTVTVYLSTSDDLNLGEPGSFQLVSVVGEAGENFFAIPGAADEKFTHGIIWCGAAAIPFGFAPLN